jgi:hypothetical protein
MRDGEETARRLARRWKLDYAGNVIAIEAGEIDDLYLTLIKMCYLTPAVETVLPAGLLLYNALGYMGLRWVRYRAGAEGKKEFMN